MQSHGLLLMKLNRLTGMLKEQKKSLEQDLMLEDELVNWLQMTSEYIRQTARVILIKDTNRFGHKAINQPWELRTSTDVRHSLDGGSGGVGGAASPWKDPFFTTRKGPKPASNRGTILSTQSATKDTGGLAGQTERRAIDRIAFLEARRSAHKSHLQLDVSGGSAEYRNRNHSLHNSQGQPDVRNNLLDGSAAQLTPKEHEVLKKYMGPNIYKYGQMKSEDLLKATIDKPKTSDRLQHFLLPRHRGINSLGGSPATKELGLPQGSCYCANRNKLSDLPTYLYSESRDSSGRIKQGLDESNKTDEGNLSGPKVEMQLGLTGRATFITKQNRSSSRTDQLEVPAIVSRVNDWRKSEHKLKNINMSMEIPVPSGAQGTEVDLSPLLQDKPERYKEADTGNLLTEPNGLKTIIERHALTERSTKRINSFVQTSGSQTQSDLGKIILNFQKSHGVQTAQVYPNLMLVGSDHRNQSQTGDSKIISGPDNRFIPSSMPNSNRHLNPESKSALKLSKSILYLTKSKNSSSSKKNQFNQDDIVSSQEDLKGGAKTSTFLTAFPQIATLTIAEVEMDPSENSGADRSIEQRESAKKSDQGNPSSQIRVIDGSQSRAERTAQFQEGAVTYRRGDSLENIRQGWVNPHLSASKTETSSQAILNRGMTFSDVSMQVKSQKSVNPSPSRSPIKERFFFQPTNRLQPEQN
jgi:hypothetical protein